MTTLTIADIKNLVLNGLVKSLRWRKDYGDGECTDDTVLWINGHPTSCVISGLSSQCRCAYIDDHRVGFYYDTNKKVKEVILNKLGL